MKTLLFEVPGEPVAKQRARTLRSGHSFTPAKTVQFENLVRYCFMQKYPCEAPTENPVAIQIVAVYPIPKSYSKKDKIRAILMRLFPRKNDWDNVAKAVCDALINCAYHDDKQVFYGSVFKRYGDRPRTVVKLEIFNDEDLERGIEKIWQESMLSFWSAD